MIHNLALLPSSERQRIELIKQAHLLVWRRRRNEIGREVVVAAIDEVDEEHREWFRQQLNAIRGQAWAQETPCLSKRWGWPWYRWATACQQ